jgi:hypothetical protein
MLGPTRGVKGPRPTVGTRDCKDRLSVFAGVHAVTAAWPSNTLESPARARQRTGLSTTRRLPGACAAQLRRVGRTYPAERPQRVVLLIDNAPWQRGKPVAEALAENPHRELKRLPSSSPQWNLSERFGRVRRRAPHNRWFGLWRI